MWIVIIEYGFDNNEILFYENIEQAEERYQSEKSAGQIVYLTKRVK